MDALTNAPDMGISERATALLTAACKQLGWLPPRAVVWTTDKPSRTTIIESFDGVQGWRIVRSDGTVTSGDDWVFMEKSRCAALADMWDMGCPLVAHVGDSYIIART